MLEPLWVFVQKRPSPGTLKDHALLETTASNVHRQTVRRLVISVAEILLAVVILEVRVVARLLR